MGKYVWIVSSPAMFSLGNLEKNIKLAVITPIYITTSSEAKQPIKNSFHLLSSQSEPFSNCFDGFLK